MALCTIKIRRSYCRVVSTQCMYLRVVSSTTKSIRYNKKDCALKTLNSEFNFDSRLRSYNKCYKQQLVGKLV